MPGAVDLLLDAVNRLHERLNRVQELDASRAEFRGQVIARLDSIEEKIRGLPCHGSARCPQDSGSRLAAAVLRIAGRFPRWVQFAMILISLVALGFGAFAITLRWLGGV
jgi:hypothetical protein